MIYFKEVNFQLFFQDVESVSELTEMISQSRLAHSTSAFTRPGISPVNDEGATHVLHSLDSNKTAPSIEHSLPQTNVQSHPKHIACECDEGSSYIGVRDTPQQQQAPWQQSSGQQQSPTRHQSPGQIPSPGQYSALGQIAPLGQLSPTAPIAPSAGQIAPPAGQLSPAGLQHQSPQYPLTTHHVIIQHKDSPFTPVPAKATKSPGTTVAAAASPAPAKSTSFKLPFKKHSKKK